ncbi:hypothetical protein SAY87_009392 [Trapa incisa]|uniref:Uncharacterized protein n=1 Tax=Trapa incisa TaxID=236973 RepID=A0AAN7K0M9_9MYRT|nr:hypothetical protein SAY87_009392 [Trapa incisa]
MDGGSGLQINTKMDVPRDAPGSSTDVETVGACIESEVKLMHCMSNFVDSAFNMETSVETGLKGEMNDEIVEVDITNEGPSITDVVEIEEPVVGQDSTENSSSFSGTISGSENAAILSDGEVESKNLDGNESGYYLPGFYEGFTLRKKRLTDHWTRFIHPLKWRCRWLELQIKEFQSRALQYDKELEGCEEAKQHLFENSMLEEVNSRSLAFSGQLPKKDVMKRRKRKRIEETMDMASYMSNHNLFSYYDKKNSSERFFAKDGNGNRAMTNGMPSLGSDNSIHLRDGDTSMEQILARIMMAQSQIHQLKTRIEKVISENPGKFSSVNRLSLAVSGSAGNISDEVPASPATKGQLPSIKSLCAAAELVSDGDATDLLLPSQPISEHLGITALPDVVESTKKIEDGLYINSGMVEKEMLDSEKVGDEEDMKPEKEPERLKVALSAGIAEAALPVGTPTPLDTENVKFRAPLKTYVSRNKRKRRRRGAAAHKKTKRLPG